MRWGLIRTTSQASAAFSSNQMSRAEGSSW